MPRFSARRRAARGVADTVTAMYAAGSTRRLRHRQAFTFAELIVVFVVLSIIVAVSYAVLTGVESRVSGGSNTNKMRQVASALGMYQQSRGYFPTDAATVATVSGIQVTTGESSSAGLVAVAGGTIASEDVLGLAVRNSDGVCYTLMTPPTGSATPETRGKFTATSSAPCSGTAALAVVGTAW